MTRTPEELAPQQAGEPEPSDVQSTPAEQLPSGVSARMLAASVYYGPLPPPDDLKAYSEIVPDAAERMLAMAEKQAHHRQEMERRQLELDRVGTLTSLRHERWGLVCGTVCVLALIAAALWIAWLGNTNAAAILGTGTLAGVATAFVVGTRARQRQVGVQPTSSRQPPPELQDEQPSAPPPAKGTGQ